MKKILTLFLLAVPFFLASQTDTTIYKIVEEMPRLPGCEAMDTTLDVKAKCAETRLLQFFNNNINYPFEARDSNVQGTVVLRFIVEPDGLVSSAKLLRDIGGGCGEEALRVANGMNKAMQDAFMRWSPGKRGGKPVRTEISVPIKFRLEAPKDFIVMDGRDTLYLAIDDSVSYKAGNPALESFLKNTMKTPEIYRDSCKVGVLDLTLYVHPSGYVRVIDLTDYWHLGNDFKWEAIRAATATWGQWQPAKRNGTEVPSSVEISMPIVPQTVGCQQVVSNFSKANLLAEEGSRLFNEGQYEAGIAKLGEAIALFPENANFLYLRGQAYMTMDRNEDACADFLRVRAIVTIGLVENILPLICK